MFGAALELSEEDIGKTALEMGSWDVAIRYHEFKAQPSKHRHLRHLRKISAQAVLERAVLILGSVVRPVERKTVEMAHLPPDSSGAELEIDQTLEESAFEIATGRALGPENLYFSYDERKRQPIVLSIDTSLSMTGEKLALTAVALAVVLLQFPDDPVGIVAFENEAVTLKAPDERITVQEFVERFMDVPAQGYTHLEDGLREALILTEACSLTGRKPSTVLITDGKYTAGRDPAYLAPRFPHLTVIKMGAEKASEPLCHELATLGRGELREVADLDDLPQVMYGTVKDLLRGRA